MFKSLNIGSKLVLSVAISVIVAIVVLISIVSSEVASFAEREAKNALFISSKRYVNYMEGILNEPIVLTKSTASSLNEIFSQYDQIDVNLVESIVKNTFDSSARAEYAFLYLKDPSVLSNTAAIDKNFISQDGSTFAMIFSDTTLERSGGIKVIRTPNNFAQLSIIREIEQNAKYGDHDSVFFGPPTHLNYNGNEFLGINLGMPIFNNKGKLVGAIGYSLDFNEISKALLDPSLDLFEGNIRMITNDQGVIAVHNTNPGAILKNLIDINKDPSINLINDAVKEHRQIIIDNYTDSMGQPSYASITPFNTLNNSSKWSVVVTAPKKSVLAPLYKLEFIIVGVAAIALIAILVVVYFCVRKIVGARIPIILKALENFFRFLNHEKVEVHTIKIRADDELGKMGKIINENILATKQGLEQDAKAVKESVETVGVVESGNLTARITANP
ncbi:cache domain-containing protein, partial [Campylobacter coli]